ISQASSSATFQSKRFQGCVTGFGVISNRNETGLEAGNSDPISNVRRGSSAGAAGSGLRSNPNAPSFAPELASSGAAPSNEEGEVTVATDGGAGICQDGSATDRIGSASKLTIATLQTRCLDAADALRNEAVSNPAADKIMALLTKVSSDS